MTAVPEADRLAFFEKLGEFRKCEDSDSYWSVVLRFVYGNKDCLRDLDSLRACCRFLQSRLIELKCADRDVVARVMRTSSMWFFGQILADSRWLSGGDADRILLPLDLEKEVVCIPLFCDLELVDLCCEMAEDVLMKVLIYHGVTDSPRVESFQEFSKACELLTTFWLYVDQNELQEPNFDNLSSVVRCSKEVLHDLRSTNGRIQSGKEKGFVRILLMLRILDVVMLKRKGSSLAEDYTTCLKRYLRIIPDPFFSKEEIQEFLEFLLFDEKDVARSMMLTYENMFPYESSLPYAPRSLKHLSRYSVRRYLKPSLLFVAVQQLDIPKYLKDFIVGIA